MNPKVINEKVDKYQPGKIEEKWQKKWEEERIYQPDMETSEKPFYNLMMFPYPSAEGMHVGNMYAFTGSDIYGRFKRLQGFNVFEPMGLDGFGIHSENYAIKVGRHPMEQAKISEKNFYRQLRATGNGFDWSRTVETYDQEYYKWTQWIFIQLYKKGLAYRKKAPVNFCPSCKTVLADEQVIDGKCERCSSIVEKKELEQWFFKITQYAEKLLQNIEKLDWSEKVKIAQRNWIGKKAGTKILFDLKGTKDQIEVFTTRADTLYGATFIVLAPEHPFVAKLLKFKIQKSRFDSEAKRAKFKSEIKEYINSAKKKSELDRIAEDKTGVFTGYFAVNPLNNEEIPIWIADYAVMEYGTGALFGDAHDERDVEFANKYKIPLKPTLITGDKEKDERIKNLEECFTGYGTLIDSGEFSELTSQEAMKKITEWLIKKRSGGFQTTYHLRDWLISRQRYWGPPIPIIYCDKCGMVPVPEKDLPVELPYIKEFRPAGKGQSPLASVPKFYNVKCPKCDGPARRETDVSDTFLDSAWYFLRYPSTRSARSGQAPFDLDITRKWLPVDMYIGGAEHSVLHLLYSRFVTMVFNDLGLIDFEEPYKKFRAHGLIIAEGAKMSKSKGNVVIPDKYISQYGADTLRMYLMFMAPFNEGGDFRDAAVEGIWRFLKRVWQIVQSTDNKQATKDEKRILNQTIKKITGDIENLHYNTAISALMELLNFISKQGHADTETIKNFLIMLAPFAPHITEELWYRFGTFEVGSDPLRRSFSEARKLDFDSLNSRNLDITYSVNKKSILQCRIQAQKNPTSNVKNSKFKSVHQQLWPSYDSQCLAEEETVIAVQVNGKLRDAIRIQNSESRIQNDVEEKAMKREKIIKHLEGKSVKKVIYIEGKVINFVV